MKRYAIAILCVALFPGVAAAALQKNYVTKSVPVAGDKLLIVDSEDEEATKQITIGSLPGTPIDLTAPGNIGTVTPGEGHFTFMEVESLEIKPPPAGSTGELAIHEDPASSGADMVGFKAPADVNVGGNQGGDLLWVLPADDGEPGQVMETDGQQTLTWVSVAKPPVEAPATATDACTAGRWAYDVGYIYVCVADGTWVRAALSTW